MRSPGAKILDRYTLSYGGQLQPFRGFPRSPGRQCYLPVENCSHYFFSRCLAVAESFARRYPDLVSGDNGVQCFGPVIEAHEPIPDGQGNVLLTWDYFGNGSQCGEAGTQVVHMTSSVKCWGKSNYHLYSVWELFLRTTMVTRSWANHTCSLRRRSDAVG